MKRSVSIIFLLLANVFLLAHAVVPHHHHDSMPVAVLDLYGHLRLRGRVPQADQAPEHRPT
jgi:hypothetical protein